MRELNSESLKAGTKNWRCDVPGHVKTISELSALLMFIN